MGVPIRDWLYFIGDGKGNFARIVNGTPQMLGGPPEPLPQDPDGWRDIEVGFATDTAYFSLNRMATVPTTFVGVGAQILRYYMYGNKGYNANLYLYLLVRNPATGQYVQEFLGKLDMLRANNNPATGTVTVPAKQGGPMSFIEANEGVVYEMGNLPSFEVRFDGMTFQNKLTWVYGVPETSTLDLTREFYFTFPLVFKQEEGLSFDLVKNESVIDEPFSNPTPYIPTSTEYMVYRPYETVATTGGKIICEGQGTPATVNIYFLSSKTFTEYAVVTGFTIPNSPTITTITIPALNITLQPDERLFLLVRRTSTTGAEVIGIYDGTEVTLSINTKAQPTDHIGHTPLSVGQELVKRMSGGECTFRSDYFEANDVSADGSQVCLFSGQSLRNLPSPVLKTSFQDFFQFYDSLRPMALLLDGGVIRMEPIEDIYGDGAEIFDIGEISDVSIEYAFDAICNTGKFGYPTRDKEQVNGVPEYNGINTFQFPVTVLRKEYSKVGKYVASPSQIERIRRASTALNNNDRDDIDNTVYGVHISVVSGTPQLTRETYTTISGVVNGSDVYNIKDMTPARMLRAHGSVLTAMLEQQVGQSIKWTSTDRSATLATVQPGLTVIEKGDTPLGALTPAIMRMFDLTFNVPAPYPFSEVLVGVGRGVIRAEFLGNELFFIPIGEMKSKPASSEPQEWKLRLSTRTTIASLNSLSLEGIFSIDSMNNTIFISDLNPIHFSKYGFEQLPQYHHLEIYDAPFADRNSRMYTQPFYAQKWQKTDEPKLQFVSAGYSPLTVKMWGAAQIGEFLRHVSDWASLTALLADISPVVSQTCTVIPDTSVQLPYILQQTSFPLSARDEDYYLMVVYDGSTPLFISEWLWVRENWSDTYRWDYYHTTSKYNTYWSQFRPHIRCEANFLPILPQADSEQYEDELKDNEQLNGRPWDKRVLIIGDGAGIPDWMARKINMIMLLNRTNIEGDNWTRSDKALMEAVVREGYPMNYYQLEVQPGRASTGLIFTGTPEAIDDVIAYTLDAASIGQGEGVVNIEVRDE